MKLVIVALRRSGTTAFWSAFRQDPRLVCFNEPFNPQLASVGAKTWGHRSVHSEYVRLLERDATQFWRHYRPIAPEEELAAGYSDRQRDYLRYLLEQSEHVCIDTTRSYCKLDDLHAMCTEGIVVHLFRPPHRFASSILVPNDHLIRRNPRSWRREWTLARRKVSNALSRRAFWRLAEPKAFDYSKVLRRGTLGQFAKHAQELGLDPDVVDQMPAVGRLLVLWKLAYDEVETRGRALWGDRFISVNFHDFAREPERTLARVYEKTGVTMPNLDLGYVRPPTPLESEGDIRWQEYSQMLALPEYR